MTLPNLLLLILAGAAGTLARCGVGWLVGQFWRESTFPWATLLVNVLGCFVLAAVVVLAGQGRLSPETRLLIGSGFCGAFTTFSTFALETQQLFARGATLEACAYALGNLLLGFLAVLGAQAMLAR